MTSMLGHVRNAATSRTKVKDHHCDVGYPITVHTSATAVDVGNVRDPLPVGAWALHFGAGHPLNGSGPVMPASEQYASPYQTTSSVSVGSVSRRAELISAIEALVAIKDFYSGDGVRGVCAHVYTDSIYVAKVWGEWLEMWARTGWPGEGEEPEPTVPIQDRRPTAPGLRDSGIAMSISSHGSPASRTSTLPSGGGMSRTRSYSRQSAKGVGSIKAASSILSAGSDVSFSMTSPHLFTARGRPFDEDLMRELADLREYFGQLQRASKGGCYFYAASRGESPAWNLSRELARQSGAEVLRTAGQSRRRRPNKAGSGERPPSVMSEASKASRSSRSAGFARSGMTHSSSWRSDGNVAPEVPAIPRQHARTSRAPDLPACEASPTISSPSDRSLRSRDSHASIREVGEGATGPGQRRSEASLSAPLKGALKKGSNDSSQAMGSTSDTRTATAPRNRHVARFTAVSPVPESPTPRIVDLPAEEPASSSQQAHKGGARTSRRLAHYASKDEVYDGLSGQEKSRKGNNNSLPPAAVAAGWSTEQLDSDESDVRHSGQDSPVPRQLSAERFVQPDVPTTDPKVQAGGHLMSQLEKEPKKKGFFSRFKMRMKA